MADQSHADKFSALGYDLIYNKLVDSTEIPIDIHLKETIIMKHHSNLLYLDQEQKGRTVSFESVTEIINW